MAGPGSLSPQFRFRPALRHRVAAAAPHCAGLTVRATPASMRCVLDPAGCSHPSAPSLLSLLAQTVGGCPRTPDGRRSLGRWAVSGTGQRPNTSAPGRLSGG